MKFYCYIFSFYLFLIATFPVSQELSRVNELISHYVEHLQRAEDKDMSFSEFIVLHYADENHDKTEPHDDLPFHHKHQSHCSHFFVFNVGVIPTQFEKLNIEYAFVNTSLKVPNRRFLHLSTNFFGIWQPPKLA